jgi:hypothetical protein
MMMEAGAATRQSLITCKGGNKMRLSGLELVNGRIICIGLLTISGSGEQKKEMHRPSTYSAALVTGSGRAFPLTKPLVRIGRTDRFNEIFPEVDLSTEDPMRYISRRHARLLRKGQQWVLVGELGAKHGTYLNGRRLDPGVEVPLRSGDSIRLAKTELIFRSKNN